MNRNIALFAILALCSLLSSCRPKPISGQIFVVTQAGLNLPLGAVQVEVITAKDAADFMQRCQTEIDGKAQALKEAYGEAEKDYDDAIKVDSQAREAMRTAEYDETCAGDARYIALSDEKAKNLKTIETLTKAIDYLNRQLYPAASTIATFTPPSPDEVRKRSDANRALQMDEARCSLLRQNLSDADNQLANIKYNFMAPYRDAESRADTALGNALAKSRAAATALKSFPTADDYLDDFLPSPIETTVTDAEGNFIIQNPKTGAKVFAKAQRQTLDSTENYFWLVDLPPAGDKLILSNNNMFTVPAVSP